MSGEKRNVDDLLKRIDELVDIFKILSDDLKEISNILKSTAASEMRTSSTVPESVEAPKPLRTIDDVKKVFSQDLAGMLFFEETDEYVLIKPRQWLGSDNFAKIAAIVRDQLGGEYVSAGKESHFRISRKG